MLKKKPTSSERAVFRIQHLICLKCFGTNIMTSNLEQISLKNFRISKKVLYDRWKKNYLDWGQNYESPISTKMKNGSFTNKQNIRSLNQQKSKIICSQIKIQSWCQEKHKNRFLKKLEPTCDTIVLYFRCFTIHTADRLLYKFLSHVYWIKDGSDNFDSDSEICLNLVRKRTRLTARL